MRGHDPPTAAASAAASSRPRFFVSTSVRLSRALCWSCCLAVVFLSRTTECGRGAGWCTAAQGAAAATTEVPVAALAFPADNAVAVRCHRDRGRGPPRRSPFDRCGACRNHAARGHPACLRLRASSSSPSRSFAMLSAPPPPRPRPRPRIGVSLGATSSAGGTGFAEQPYTQVITDVDDTLKSSGGVNVGGVALGGIDVQYDRGEFYPGVFEFMLQMSLHSLLDEGDEYGDGGGRAAVPAKVAVLTARAEEFKAALELKDDSKLGRAFRTAGERAGVEDWGLGPVLYGSVAEWLVQDRKGLRKFANFERLIEQDPTGTVMQYVYVGDTGEFDQEAGETMLREYPEVVKAVFLHVVSDVADPPVPPPKLINGRPVVFFRTYVGAAARAAQLGLMTPSGLLRVVRVAREALSLSGVSRSESKWVELERDAREAYRTLGISDEGAV